MFSLKPMLSTVLNCLLHTWRWVSLSGWCCQQKTCKDNLAFHSCLEVAAVEIPSILHLAESSHGVICSKENEHTVFCTLVSQIYQVLLGIKDHIATEAKEKENTGLSLDWCFFFFSYLENPQVSEDFNNRILFCAFSGERGNDIRDF